MRGGSDQLMTQRGQTRTRTVPRYQRYFFDDDTFIGKQRVLDLCEKFKPSTLPGLALPASTLIWKRFRQCAAGCRCIVGFESGNPQILKNIKKLQQLSRLVSS